MKESGTVEAFLPRERDLKLVGIEQEGS